MIGPSTSDAQPEDLCVPPALIIYGLGPTSEETAQELAEQFQRARIRSRVRAIDDCADIELGQYRSLIACLPTPDNPTNVRQVLEPFAALVASYRARWRFKLSHILDGTVKDVLDAGVVQLYGETALLQHPTMRTAYKTACYVHATDEDRGFDVLRPYRQAVDPSIRPQPWNDSTDVVHDVIARTWAYVQSWGATDITSVSTLLACIEKCRAHFEDPSKPALYRPAGRMTPRNRLDFILDGPDLTPSDESTRKTWNENGARAFRYVRDQLKAIQPSLKRPGSALAPNAQKDLRRLYESLKLLDAQASSA